MMRFVSVRHLFFACGFLMALAEPGEAMRGDRCAKKSRDCIPENDPIVLQMDRLSTGDHSGAELLLNGLYKTAQGWMGTFIGHFRLRLGQYPALKEDIKKNCEHNQLMHDWLRCAVDGPETETALNAYVATHTRARYVRETARKYGIDLSPGFKAFDHLEQDAYFQIINATPLSAQGASKEGEIGGNPEAVSKTGNIKGRNHIEDDGTPHHRGVLLELFPEADACKEVGTGEKASEPCPNCALEEDHRLALPSLNSVVVKKIKAARFLVEAEARAYVDVLASQNGIDSHSFENGLSALNNACRITRSFREGQSRVSRELFDDHRAVNLAQTELSRSIFGITRNAMAQFHISPKDKENSKLIEKQKASFAGHQTQKLALAIASAKKLFAIDKAIGALKKDFPLEPSNESSAWDKLLSVMPCQIGRKAIETIAQGVRERASTAKCPPVHEVLKRRLSVQDEQLRLESGGKNNGDTEADDLIRNGLVATDGETLIDATPEIAKKGSTVLACYRKVLSIVRLENLKSKYLGSSLELTQVTLANGESPEDNAMWRCMDFRMRNPPGSQAYSYQNPCTGIALDQARYGIAPEKPAYLYEHLGQANTQSNAAAWGQEALVLKKQLNPNAIASRLNSIQKAISTICADPLGAGGEVYANDSLYDSFLNCGDAPGGDVPEPWRVYEEHRWKSCVARKKDARSACLARKMILEEQERSYRANGKKALETFLDGVDLVSCAALAPMAKGLYGFGKLALTEGLGAASENFLASSARAALGVLKGQLKPTNFMITSAMFAYGKHEEMAARANEDTTRAKTEAGLSDYRDWQSSKRRADEAAYATGHLFVLGLLLPAALEAPGRAMENRASRVPLLSEDAKVLRAELKRLESEPAFRREGKVSAELARTRLKFDDAMRGGLESALGIPKEGLRALTHDELAAIARDEHASISIAKIEEGRRQMLSALYDPDLHAQLGSQSEQFMVSVEHAFDSGNPEGAVRALADAYKQMDSVLQFAPTAEMSRSMVRYKANLDQFLEKSLRGLGYSTGDLPAVSNWPERVRLFAEGILNESMRRQFSANAFSGITEAVENFRKQFQLIYRDVDSLRAINAPPKFVWLRLRPELAKLSELKKIVADEFRTSPQKPSEAARKLLLEEIDQMDGLVRSFAKQRFSELAGEYHRMLRARSEANLKALGTEISKRFNRGGSAQLEKFESILNDRRMKAAKRLKLRNAEAARAGQPEISAAEYRQEYAAEWKRDYLKRKKHGARGKNYPSIEETIALFAFESNDFKHAARFFFENYGTIRLRNRIWAAMRSPFDSLIRRPWRWMRSKTSKTYKRPQPKLSAERGLLGLWEKRINVNRIDALSIEELSDFGESLGQALSEAVYGPSLSRVLKAAFAKNSKSFATDNGFASRFSESVWKEVRASFLKQKDFTIRLRVDVHSKPRLKSIKLFLEKGIRATIQETATALNANQARMSEIEVQRNAELLGAEISTFLKPALVAFAAYQSPTAAVLEGLRNITQGKPLMGEEPSTGEIANEDARYKEANEDNKVLDGEVDEALKAVREKLKNKNLSRSERKELEKEQLDYELYKSQL